MDDKLHADLPVKTIFKAKVATVDEAIEISNKYLEDIRPDASWRKGEPYRLGKAVLVYLPFWQFKREDGNELKTIYRPAFGTIMSNIQKLENIDGEEENTELLPNMIEVSLNAEYYYPTLNGIPRDEKLIGIPFWFVSYKMLKSIYMMKILATNGEVIPEWHPIKETVNWTKIILLSFIPVLILSILGVTIHPLIFLIVAAYIIYLIYESNMLSLLDKKKKEEEKGEEDGA